jgi:putative transposase
MSYSIDLRDKVVSYIQKGGSIVEAAQVFDVGRRTIHRWLKQLKTEGHMKKKRYVRTRFKIDREALQVHIAEHPDAYLKERAKVFNVSHVGIWRALQAMKITRKKKSVPTKNVMKQNDRLIKN